ncbi:glycoside hydrolase family protein [Tamlana sp. 2201CG12-4]|uniref:glycoside hydrolase family protein n=1 Tax=Tamlana sp. 2201CG12-4 TaxID=3112582 RepID=UPI002DBB2ADA|nr:glycoside hydrolase family protein [Tamlana sp. 2201CG12-4]MEC3907203.1 glycoside hydrolase family protein [Tamlana sp. 2201CG12-4]
MKLTKRPLCLLFSILLVLISCQSTKKVALADDLSFKNRLQPVTEDNIFKDKDYYNWGASIIKGKDNLYHLFYSRWKREYGFYAWLTHSEIAHAVSKNPDGPWQYKETVLKGRGGNGWDAITAHNPKIKFFDGKYYLYYIGSHLGGKLYTNNDLIKAAKNRKNDANWRTLRPNMRTGVAIATSLDGPWKRLNDPIVEPSGPITTLTVNPAIDRGADGKYYLVVKGDKPDEKKFIRNQAIAISKFPDGPFIMQPKPVIDYRDTEDMSIWFDNKRNRFYGIYHAHTFIGLIASKNGIDWVPANEEQIMQKSIPLKGNGFIKPDRMERPFIYLEEGKPKTLCLAVKKKDDSFMVFVPIRSKNK